MAVFHCPGCNYLKTVDDKHLGRSAECPKCKTQGSVCDPQTLLSPKTTGDRAGVAVMPSTDTSVPASTAGDAERLDAPGPTASDMHPPQPAPLIHAKVMGKCPLCGEATFDLGDHYARKHPPSEENASRGTALAPGGLAQIPRTTTAKEWAQAKTQKELGVDALYVKARNVNEGMHRFHKYAKLTAFACMGFALWANDFADNWVGFLCNHVDNATQSTLWAWTAGWFTPAPPAITPLYRTYNFIMTVVAVVSTIIASRWFFWTTLMMKLEANRSASTPASLDNLLKGVVSEHKRFFGWWVAEYIGLGAFGHFIYGFFQGMLGWGQQLFAIPIQPTITAVVMAFISAGTISFLSEYLLTEEAEEERRKHKATSPTKA